jgi:allophanate hydrolase
VDQRGTSKPSEGGTAEPPFTLSGIADAYAAGMRPADLIAETYRRIAALGDPGIFLHLVPEAEARAESEALGRHDPARPLWGVPFAVKDNIDVAGCPTTAACPAFAYLPAEDAPVVARLRAAGAIPIGKTNLDQFATGLVGLRTPHPAPLNALDPEIVPGGSSSGSAVAVARGLVAFALGTDTAGSGRVPAALNNIVGLKPSPGALSTRGVVPACRTLDAVSVFALTVADAHTVYRAAAGFDPADPYSRPVSAAPAGAAPPRPRVGVPGATGRRFFGDTAEAAAFEAACRALAANGAEIVEIDFAPFHAVADMLYEGAWLAERHVVVGDLLATDPDAVHPVIRQVVGPAARLTATDAFRGFYRLAALRREIEPILASVDLLCVPSVPTFYRRADLEADPIGPNARLGTYTNFVNLLGLCGLAVPTPPRGDGRPGSVTLLAEGGRDGLLASLGLRIEAWGDRRLGATPWTLPRPAPSAAVPVAGPGELEIAVCGAHMSGLPLNGELARLGARFLRSATTTPDYRLYRLPGGPPARPGLVRNATGARIAVEVWALPRPAVGEFLAGVPAPLGLGAVSLSDGTAPKGFLCEAAAVAGAEDVTAFGDWRRVLAEAAA